MTDTLLRFFVEIIETLGYLGVAFLMMLESTVVPVPSEAVMPFAGFLWSLGEMSFWPIVLWSTAGSVVGSLFSYAIGFWGGRALLVRYGKYVLLNIHHLEATERFFARRGAAAIFMARFIPIVRHLISLPAGMGKMNIPLFITCTALGAGMWNAFLAYVGFSLGNRWETVQSHGTALDIAILGILLAALAFWVIRLRRERADREKISDHDSAAR